MPYNAIVYSVMIASPGDVAAEREICREVINEWNIINSELRKIVLLPVMWERNTRPEMGGRGQAIVNRQILHKADLLIGIFWKKIGTPTGQSISGTVEEIEEHIEEGKPAMLYFSDKPVPPSEFNNEQYQAVKKLQTDYFDSGLIGGFNGDEDFRMKLKNHLALTINNSQYFIPEAERSIFESFEQQTNEEKLSEDATRLLIEASRDANGQIIRMGTFEDLSIQTNQLEFACDKSPRLLSKIKGAFEELIDGDYIRDVGYQGQIFYVTEAGYNLAEKLIAESDN